MEVLQQQVKDVSHHRKMDKVEIRSVIRILHAEGKGPTEIHRVLVYGEGVMARWQVSVWCTAFAEGRTNVDDKPRSGGPSTSSTDYHIAQVDNLIQADRRCKIRDMALELDISKSVVHEIVHEKLGYRKVSTKTACVCDREEGKRGAGEVKGEEKGVFVCVWQYWKIACVCCAPYNRTWALTKKIVLKRSLRLRSSHPWFSCFHVTTMGRKAHWRPQIQTSRRFCRTSALVQVWSRDFGACDHWWRCDVGASPYTRIKARLDDIRTSLLASSQKIQGAAVREEADDHYFWGCWIE